MADHNNQKKVLLRGNLLKLLFVIRSFPNMGLSSNFFHDFMEYFSSFKTSKKYVFTDFPNYYSKIKLPVVF